MTNLNEAYQVAFEKLRQHKPVDTVLIVEKVIELKHWSSEFELLVKMNVASEDLQLKLMQKVTEMLATSVATMCTVAGKGFNDDILPLIKRVTEEASTGNHLQ